MQVDNNVLTVKGQCTETRTEEDEGKVWRTERQRRSFSRSFTLPSNIKSEEICAKLDKGVLCVCVPKGPEEPKPEPKRIEVKSA